VQPERRAAESLQAQDPDLTKWRAMGFTTALSVPRGGIFRAAERWSTLRTPALPRCWCGGRDPARGVTPVSGGRYPGSLMA